MFKSAEKPIESAIRNKLSSYFSAPQKPLMHLEILNESGMHNVPKGSETHFKVVVVSDYFEGMGPLERHRTVHSILSDELSNGVHALSVTAKTSNQWATKPDVPISPNCMGGMKHSQQKN